ncbi:BspA family leucine-rich repeat surface protein [Enterococcus sp. 22-H-5-01]|uniref:BspA family leucine-rich repeat surface protein n=1 Tax=Enterococcus sp. 22-H-5-01 TaxID=3418555 RepID=UPI003D053F8F
MKKIVGLTLFSLACLVCSVSYVEQGHAVENSLSAESAIQSTSIELSLSAETVSSNEKLVESSTVPIESSSVAANSVEKSEGNKSTESASIKSTAPSTNNFSTMAVTASGTWGTVDWVFDSASGTLTFTSGGNLGLALNSPWNTYVGTNPRTPLVSPTSIKKIIFTKKVSVTSAANLFSAATGRSSDNCLSKLVSIENLSLLDTSQCTSMAGMFAYASSLTSIDMKNCSTALVSSMDFMFYETQSLKEIKGLDKFNTSKVTVMNQMFLGTGLSTINVSSFDTSRVYDMRYMFYRTSNLTSLDLSNFNTNEVSYMQNMFTDSSIKELNISSFDTSTKYTNMDSMFLRANNLSTLTIGPKFKDTANKSQLTNVPTNALYIGQWIYLDKNQPVGQTATFLNAYDGSKPGTYVWQRKYKNEDGQTSLILKSVPKSFDFTTTLKANGQYLIKQVPAGNPDLSNVTVASDGQNAWSVKATVINNQLKVFRNEQYTGKNLEITDFSINDQSLLATGASGAIIVKGNKSVSGESSTPITKMGITFSDPESFLKVGDSLSSEKEENSNINNCVSFQLYDTANAS